MRESADRSRMRGVATTAGIGEIEFEDGAEAVVLARRVVREHLPPAKKNNRAATIMQRAKTQRASGKHA